MKLVILHFRQKKLYPPLINMLSFLDANHIDYKLIGDYKTASSRFKYYNQLSLYFNYLKFVFFGFIALFKNKNSVLYYESLSAMPIVVYLFFFKSSKLRVFVHFHEYFSKREYERQSLLERLGRKYELSLFKRAEWISHTNEDRLKLFQKDIDFKIDEEVLRTMPNYPSRTWISTNENLRRESDGKIRLLHIGSVSFTGMYLKELLDHFGNNQKYEIHFYSHTQDDKLITTLKTYYNIYHHGSIDYNQILTLKNKYDVGLVLYKGESLNFIYNAPNKIFEYLALDLDVWCSDKLLTVHRYKNEHTYPKIVMVDYDNLSHFNDREALDKSTLIYKSTSYFSENAYKEFITQLKKKK